MVKRKNRWSTDQFFCLGDVHRFGPRPFALEDPGATAVGLLGAGDAHRLAPDGSEQEHRRLGASYDSDLAIPDSFYCRRLCGTIPPNRLARKAASYYSRDACGWL